MSAWIVSKRHIDAMVSAALDAGKKSHYGPWSWYHDGARHQLTEENATEVGEMLWAENIRSVGYRYSPPGREFYYGSDLGKDADLDTELPGSYRSEEIAPGVVVEMPEWAEPYTFKPYRELSPGEVFKMIGCYEYQSCEHAEWETSSARAFCRELADSYQTLVPGYEDAPWGFE